MPFDSQQIVEISSLGVSIKVVNGSPIDLHLGNFLTHISLEIDSCPVLIAALLIVTKWLKYSKYLSCLVKVTEITMEH